MYEHLNRIFDDKVEKYWKTGLIKRSLDELKAANQALKEKCVEEYTDRKKEFWVQTSGPIVVGYWAIRSRKRMQTSASNLPLLSQNLFLN